MSGDVNLCVDAGGTNCRARLVGAAGETLAEAVAGPCNPATDLAGSAANLRLLWVACADAAGGDPRRITLALGGAGLGMPAVRAAFLAAGPPFGRVVVMSDGYAALIGAGGGAPCGLIIAGTGVAGHRLLADGRSILRDGWGWVGGDRGSGAWFGLRALRHALAVADGVRPADALTARVNAALEAAGGARAFLVGVGPARLASLAPLVLDAADAGDRTARGMVDRAVAHLAALADALAVPADESLYLAGGLAAVLRPGLAARLGRTIAAPAADALAGCHFVATGAAPAEQPMAENRVEACA